MCYGSQQTGHLTETFWGNLAQEFDIDHRVLQGLLYRWTEHSTDFFEKISTGEGSKVPN